MGLDMYLHAENYISQYDYTHNGNTMDRQLNMKHHEVDMNSGLGHLPSEGGITVSKVVLYWRKANAIHGWFVRELAGGRDECQRIYVSRDNLVTLRDLCVNALAKRDQASPTQTNVGVLKDSDNIGMAIANLIEEEHNKASVAVDDDPLAPTEGFFFGHTERDEYYYDELARTAESINALLVDTDSNLEYYYQASW